MTQKALEKIQGTVYKTTLERKKNEHQRLCYAGFENDANAVRASIAGYVQALRDCGIITERERQVLFIYYATV